MLKKEKVDIKPVFYCKNPVESYWQICVRCNKCGRFNKERAEKQ